jgi:hypothetical protein
MKSVALFAACGLATTIAMCGPAYADKFDLLCKGATQYMAKADPEPDETRFSLDTEALTIRFKRITGTNEWMPARPLTIMPDRYTFNVAGPVIIDRNSGSLNWPNTGPLGGGTQSTCEKVEYSGDVATKF